MRTAVVRKPTVREAVDYMGKILTDECRVMTIKYWRSEYGNRFADDVEMRLKGKKK